MADIDQPLILELPSCLTVSFWPLHLGTTLSDYGTLPQGPHAARLKAIHIGSGQSSSRLTASFWPLHPTTRLSDCGTLKQRSQHSKSNISTMETSSSVQMGRSWKWTGDF